LGLGFGGWGFGGSPQTPTPQSPIPNPQSPIPNNFFINYIFLLYKFEINLFFLIIFNKMQESIADKIMNQRYYSLIMNSLGEKIKIDFISGDTIEGILYTIDPKNNEYFIINNPRRLSRTGIPIFLKESLLKIYFKEVNNINYEIKNLLNNDKNNFEIDSNIHKKNIKIQKNLGDKLVKYEIKEGGNNMYINQKLEDENGDEKWDQFELNKKMYNVKSTYDENLYTTKLDKSNITEEDKRYADKIYNEIINSSKDEKNIHILEDRGIIPQHDEDVNEEEKYSSVIRDNNNKK
jgi:hypothetical protein